MKAVGWFLVLGFLLPLQAETKSDFDFSKLRVVKWGSSHGLPQETVLSLLQDNQGLIWVGTQAGIARFNGLRFQRLTNSRWVELEESSIYCLVEASNGRIWAGTSKGLAWFEKHEMGIFDQKHGLSSTDVSAVVEDKKGTLWFSTATGLYYLENEHPFKYPIPQLGNRSIRCLAADETGRLWLGTDDGLFCIKDDVVWKVALSPLSVAPKVNALHLADSGTLWVGIEKYGLLSIIDGQIERFPDPQSRETSIVSIRKRAQGGLWLATLERGLVAFVNQSFREVSGQDVLKSDLTQDVLVDHEGHLWVGTRFGLKQLCQKRYQRINSNDGLPSNRIWTAIADQKDALWLGTNGQGLIKRSNIEQNVFTEENGMPSDTVLSLALGKKGTIWAGTEQGLARIRDSKVERIVTGGNPSPLSVTSLLYGSSEVLWVGTLDGLFKLEKNSSLEPVWLDEHKAKHQVRTIFQDRDGILWIGTQRSLFRSVGQGFENIGQNLGFEAMFIAIHQDHAGDMWFGTYDSGLLRWRNGQFEAITKKQGLYSNAVFSILSDQAGHFWMSTHHAIFRVSLTDLNQVLDGKLEEVICLKFTAEQDPDFGEINGGISPSAWRDSKGQLLFPSSNGLVLLNPETAIRNLLPPKIQLTTMTVDEKVITPEGTVTLPPEAGSVSFEYTALSFEHPEKLRFQVQLQPLESEWREMGFQRTKTYYNLPAGQYQFKARAISPYGQISEQLLKISFKLPPKFYQTEYFFVAILILLGLVFISLHQFGLRKSESRRQKLEKLVHARTKALEASNLELQKVQDRLVRAAHYAGKAEIATDVLHSVGNALNSVVVSTGLVEERTRGLKIDLYEKLVPLLEKYQGELDWYLAEDSRGKKVLPTMKKMGKALRNYREKMLTEIEELQKTVRSIKQIIREQQRHADEGLQFETVSLDDLVSEAVELQTGTLAATEVSLKKEIQPGIFVRVPKIAFLQVLVNLIKNACEASVQPDSKPRVVLLKAWLKGPGWVHMEISDRGLGIDQTDITRIFRQGYTTKPGAYGFGLHFCGNIVSELKGQISVRSEGLGQGATFLLDLPVAEVTDP